MSRLVNNRFHSATIRAEMRALDLYERRLPFATMLVSVVAAANAASVVAMLMAF